MNRKPPLPHPNLALFVQVIKIEGRVQVQWMDDVRYGRVIPHVYLDTTISKIPGCYTSFVFRENRTARLS